MENQTSHLLCLAQLLHSVDRWPREAGTPCAMGRFRPLIGPAEKKHAALLATAEALSFGDLTPPAQRYASSQGYMESILETIGKGNEPQRRAAFAINALPANLSRFSFPEMERPFGDPSKLYELMTANLQQLQTADVDVLTENVRSLLERLAVNVAASDHMRDVSLYDQARTAAAITRCLYDVEQSGEQPAEEFLLVGGDFSGIQKYIYQIVSKHAGKNLKGRSFYLTLLSDAVVRRLLRDLGLGRTSIVYNSGGCFYLLAPNTTATLRRLEESIGEIERLIFQTHGTQLYVAIDSVALSRSEIINKGRRTLSDVWGALFEKRDRRKSSKYARLMADPDAGFFHPQTVGTHTDCVTGDDFSGDCSYQGIGPVHPITKAQIELGSALREADALVVSDVELKALRGGIAPASLGFYYYLLKEGDPRVLDELDTPVTIVRINGKQGQFGYTLTASETRHRHAVLFYGGNTFNGQTFEEMCENKTVDGGFTRLGVLRMDVDNLGSIFQKGIPQERASLARFAALSRSFDHFFCGYVNTICLEKQFADNSFIVYAGGDDLFIVGRWDAVIDIAYRISSNFRWYTCLNRAFSISGGVALLGAKFPLAQGALISAEEEERAKGHTLSNGSSKNSLSFLGMPLHWGAEFPKVKQCKENLVRLLLDVKLPKAFLSNVMERKESAEIRDHRVTNVKVYWQIAYETRRMKDRTKDETARQLLDTFQCDIANNQFCSESLPTNYHALELWTFAARWAELEYRSRNNHEKSE